MSYCNVSKFVGNVYNKMGFHCLNITEPNYVWVNLHNGDVLSRYKTMKHKLVSKGLGSECETEVDIMSRLGYNRIYDCGNAKYEWSR